MSAQRRPCAVLAMRHGIIDVAFTTEQRRRLADHVDLIVDQPIESWAGTPAERLADVEVVVGHWGCPALTADALATLPRLGLFAYAAGSVKEGGTVTPAVFQRGITVTTAAAANAIPVAEYTLAVVLLANKGAFVARDHLRDPSVASPCKPAVVGNVGKRVGIVGASRVGRRLIELLRPFDLETVVCDPYLTDADAHAIGVTALTLDELLATSDVVSLHAPLVPSTYGLIGKEQLATLKDGAVLINTARGRLIDTTALEAELATGRISAVLDVTWPEPLDPASALLQMPNAFITPHVAGSMGTELGRLTDAAIEEVARYVRGEPPAHPVLADEFDRLA
jgi:phosphoglycerate dehydrogenase-like enzyme